ncbi:hypothetical protein ASG51_00855 [Methylobacterium sp. Leaf465]|uniref:hypothetical protein n=1 Tax=unclassified Methylobacterium TaxID=2615210 RepID=UPI0006FA55BC|nr:MULTISPECIES: hypothetical protein [unclassified Methylobacterium]KQP76441.1 hypothetical protein ASF41_01185 [Methylobacterium sp. Leaf111]KQT84676.1 hypothetical protein ASG51_00855 [Methylobacterium sp. Leaf465]KQU35208.1 hypothetical protein ASG63_00775 [Methylobacterium sp. Leaf94]
MRLIEDVDARGGRRLLRGAYIWYRFTILAVREILTRRDTEHHRGGAPSYPGPHAGSHPRRLSWSSGPKA